jgi:excinuclease ABC subunit B
MEHFKLVSEYSPTGDQPQAIDALEESVRAGNRYQTLLGVTGSGKTFTVANLVARLNRPTLVISHNKTLAAQLYSEFKAFFPENAVEYFVSNFDYYQPEAYIPQTDTYIEKDSAINEEIERLRIRATSALVSRRDVLVVASVSCIYGLGSPEDYKNMLITIRKGDTLKREALLQRLVESLYERNDIGFERGRFRVRGEVVDIFPAYMEEAVRIEFWGDEVERIRPLNPVTGECGEPIDAFMLYPASPFVTTREKLEVAMKRIRTELAERIEVLEKQNKLVEAQRIKMRTEYDLELMQEMGFCSGIENYSRPLSGRKEGERPFCLIDFFPKDFLLIIDESHATVPQLRAMYNGDRARKEKLVEYGFRLPSALDNRPLKDSEFFNEVTGQAVFVSATPAAFELKESKVVVRQLIRPTGLLDPIMDLRPAEHQVEDFIGEALKAVEAGERVLATTLTKRMSEDLTEYLRERGLHVEYLHSDIDAIERVEILRKLRQGKFDVLVGVNLLREGLDLPEVALVAILDADKEGFLRSETSLVQTAGRAARHEKGRVLLYADKMTDSLRKAIDLTNERRARQEAYNTEHGITPTGVKRGDQESLHTEDSNELDPISVAEAGGDEDVARVLAELETDMLDAAEKLDFERAAILRDQIDALKGGAEGLKKYRQSSKDGGKKKRGPRAGTIYKGSKFSVGKKTKKHQQ